MSTNGRQHVAGQLARRQRKQFRSEDWKDASETESARAWKDYFAYFGTYSISPADHAFIRLGPAFKVEDWYV